MMATAREFCVMNSIIGAVPEFQGCIRYIVLERGLHLEPNQHQEPVLGNLELALLVKQHPEGYVQHQIVLD